MVEILDEKDQLAVKVAGHEYARYRFAAPMHGELWKPYLASLRAANGLSLLADAPNDHRHHHGIWVGHGRVNEVDCWLERNNSGRILHQEFDITSGEESGGFTEHCSWVGPDGHTVLKDSRTFTFYDQPLPEPSARAFDFEITLTAPTEAPVTLHQTNEAGLPCVRVADGLSVRTGGTLTNAEGKKNERETFKLRSNWMDCSGKLGRLSCGIAVFDHPDNPNHPTHWFTRNYGPFSPNDAFFQEEPIVISQAHPLHLRYRIYTHSGDAAEGQVAEAYRLWSGTDLVLEQS